MGGKGKGAKGTKGGKGGKGKGSGGKGGKGYKGSKGSEGKGSKGPKGAGSKGAIDDLESNHKKRKRQEAEQDWKRVCKGVETLDEEVKAESFEAFPLSKQTKRALEEFGFTTPTQVQQLTIPAALKGRDVLGAAKTGSGKTLSFVVPAVEILFRNKWLPSDGLGVVILSPTRELASQIFEVVKLVGKLHTITGGIITGGSVMEEEAGIVNLNLIVSTPGRFMHHIDATVGFDLSNTRMLVLDEADRLLDMGFKATLDNILDALPRPMQTLLFSATQTKDLDSLARVSVSNPFYASVHSNSRFATPKKLCQNFSVVPIRDKLSTIYSFIKKNMREKTIVFFSTCNQVKFVYLTFSRLLRKDNTCLMCLTGKMKLSQRKEVYEAFCQKSNAVLICTDVAARGLDFPSVKWVIQADCPDDVDTYIHRVGRTARAGANGASLLLLTPNEEKFLGRVAAKKIRIREIQVNPKFLVPVTPLLIAVLVQDSELKANAQKAVVSYLRACFFQGDKEIFNVHDVDPLELSNSYGLQKAPTLRFIEQGTKDAKNTSWELRNLQDTRKASGLTKKEKKKSSMHESTLQEARNKLQADEESSDDELLVKRMVDEGDLEVPAAKEEVQKHTVFDSDSEEGETHVQKALRELKEKQEAETAKYLRKEGKVTQEDMAQHMKDMKGLVQTVNEESKAVHKERVKDIHKKKKEKMKELAGKRSKNKDKDEGIITLEGNDEYSESEGEGESEGDEGSEGSFEYDDRSVDSLGNVYESSGTESEDEEAHAPPQKKQKKLESKEDAILRMIG